VSLCGLTAQFKGKERRAKQCHALAAWQRIGDSVRLNGSRSRECSMMETLAVSEIVN